MTKYFDLKALLHLNIKFILISSKIKPSAFILFTSYKTYNDFIARKNISCHLFFAVYCGLRYFVNVSLEICSAAS